MKKYRALIGVACAIIALIVLGFFLLRGVQFDVIQPSGDIAKQQRTLLIFATAVMAVVAVPIFIMLGIFGWKYRADNTKRKKGDYKPEWHENKRLELLWWGIPIVLIAVLAVTAFVTSHSLDPYKRIESSTKQSLEVQVVALQWKWLFIYPQLGVATVNKLPIPVGAPIHFTLSADAPMSAFWVPALGSQIYTMNGMSSQLSLIADTTGNFTGYSTNINGEGYADMKFTVQSMTDVEFSNWLEKAQQSPNLMNTAQYERLASPGLADEASYVLTDNTLYDTIVNKYMHGMAHDNGDGTHTMDDGSVMDDTEEMNHTMHTMEGM
jgi:cytochrome o ubiquinol oxidase subunit 2